jgi:hypothetical protein
LFDYTLVQKVTPSKQDLTHKEIMEFYLKQRCKAINTFLFEFETPKVLAVKTLPKDHWFFHGSKNFPVPMGILRLLCHGLVFAFLIFFQLCYSRGYQRFATAETSATTKIKGFSM